MHTKDQKQLHKTPFPSVNNHDMCLNKQRKESVIRREKSSLNWFLCPLRFRSRSPSLPSLTLPLLNLYPLDSTSGLCVIVFMYVCVCLWFCVLVKTTQIRFHAFSVTLNASHFACPVFYFLHFFRLFSYLRKTFVQYPTNIAYPLPSLSISNTSAQMSMLYEMKNFLSVKFFQLLLHALELIAYPRKTFYFSSSSDDLYCVVDKARARITVPYFPLFEEQKISLSLSFPLSHTLRTLHRQTLTHLALSFEQ